MDKKIRILHVFAALDQGGIENFVINVMKNIDLDSFEFCFALEDGREGFWDEEVTKLGGKIYYFTGKGKKIIRLYKNLKHIILYHGPFDVLHIHSYFFSGIYAFIGKKNNIKTIIVHSHATYWGQVYTLKRKIYETICRKLINRHTDFRIGCSRQACIDLFGPKCFGGNHPAFVVNNSVDYERFIFKEEARKELRKQFDLENNFVIGHVGRFTTAKNHQFLIKVFLELLKINENVKLILVGGGELEDTIKEQVKHNNIQDKVKFLGIRTDVGELLSAMDYFIFPSIFEAFPLTLIEVQCNRLPSIVSDCITRDIQLTGMMEFAIPNDPENWANHIIESPFSRDSITQKFVERRMRERKYFISDTVLQLSDLYRR